MPAGYRRAEVNSTRHRKLTTEIPAPSERGLLVVEIETLPQDIQKSPKSYGTAVALCGVFGTLGIHHFYLRDYVHGLADVILLSLSVLFFFQENILLAGLLFAIDAVHTMVIFYLLIVEQWRDGDGLPVLIK